MEETMIEIGDKIIPFYDTFVFLSSYKNDIANTDAIGPYWASIVGSERNYIIIRFVGYPDEFDVYLNRADLPELNYKFQLPESDIYDKLEEDLLRIISTGRKSIDIDDARAIHNNRLYENYTRKNVSLEHEYGISPALLSQLTSYNEYNSRAEPFFSSSKGSGILYPGMDEFNEVDVDESSVRGSREQWKDVRIKGDGNCLFRAIANGIHYNQTGKEWGLDNRDQDKLQAILRAEAVAWLCDPKNQRRIYNRYSDIEYDTVKEQIADEAVQAGFINNMQRPLDTDPKAMHLLYEEWTARAIHAYCQKKSQNGNLGRNYWGTDLEIYALAHIYNMAINVYYRTIPRDRREPIETLNASYDNYKRRFFPDGRAVGEINIYWKGLNHYHTLYPNRK